MKCKMLSTALLAFVCASSDVNAVDLKEGNWAIETKMEIVGMPMEMPAVTVDQCMSKENMVPAQRSQDGSECKITKQRVSGSTVSWTAECPNSKSRGTMTYKGTSFNGKVDIETTGSSRAMKMTSVMKGRYKGPCRK